MKQATLLTLLLGLSTLLGWPTSDRRTAEGPNADSDMVVVRLHDGRELAATIDQRTSESRLWLAYGTRTATIVRPVEWQAVIGATYRGRELTKPQLAALAARMASHMPSGPTLPPIRPQQPANRGVPRAPMSLTAQRALGFAPRIRSVRFDAALADWHGDNTADGLELHIRPHDQHGNAAVATGSLDVALLLRPEPIGGADPGSEVIPAGSMRRMTVDIDEAAFSRGLATIRLPFATRRGSGQTLRLSAGGHVRVRFTVTGGGIFEQAMEVARPGS